MSFSPQFYNFHRFFVPFILERVNLSSILHPRVTFFTPSSAASIEKSIETELLERLKQVTEGEIYNYPVVNYEKIIGQQMAEYDKEKPEAEEEEDEEEEEVAMKEELELELEEEEEEEEENYNIEYVEDIDISDDEKDAPDIEQSEEDLLALYERVKSSRAQKRGPGTTKADEKGAKKKTKSSPKVSIEYEYEEEREDDEQRQIAQAQAEANMNFNF